MREVEFHGGSRGRRKDRHISFPFTKEAREVEPRRDPGQVGELRKKECWEDLRDETKESGLVMASKESNPEKGSHLLDWTGRACFPTYKESIPGDEEG